MAMEFRILKILSLNVIGFQAALVESFPIPNLGYQYINTLTGEKT